jgi:hypothetical protein
VSTYPLSQPDARLKEALKQLRNYSHFQEFERQVRVELAALQIKLGTEADPTQIFRLQGHVQRLIVFTDLFDNAKKD